MKTILAVCLEFFEKNKDQEFDFKEIYKYVKTEMWETWKKYHPNLSNSELEERKMGEIYQLLVIDGSFSKNQDNKWSLRK